MCSDRYPLKISCCISVRKNSQLSLCLHWKYKVHVPFEIFGSRCWTLNCTNHALHWALKRLASSKSVDRPCILPLYDQLSAVVSETPLSKKVSGTTPYTSMRYKRWRENLQDLFSFVEFFLTFVKGQLERMPRRSKKVFGSVADQKAETAMYEPMVCPLHLYAVHLYESSRLRGWSLIVLSGI